jgi:hypothetical protein
MGEQIIVPSEDNVYIHNPFYKKDIYIYTHTHTRMRRTLRDDRIFCRANVRTRNLVLSCICERDRDPPILCATITSTTSIHSRSRICSRPGGPRMGSSRARATTGCWPRDGVTGSTRRRRRWMDDDAWPLPTPQGRPGTRTALKVHVGLHQVQLHRQIT